MLTDGKGRNDYVTCRICGKAFRPADDKEYKEHAHHYNILLPNNT